MMTRDAAKSRKQIEFLSLEQLVPEDHLVRKLENAIDWSFIYDLVEEKYSDSIGRPSLDPVMLIKLAVIQVMFGLRSMRQTTAEVAVNVAYRWFLGLEFQDPTPHFSTFSKNYTRRFKDTDLFEQIFQRILAECIEAELVDPSVVFVDSTHVKARANSKKYADEIAEEEAKWYAEELWEEIQQDRLNHGKKPLKEQDTSEEKDEEDDDDNDDNDELLPQKESSKGKINKNTSKKKAKRQKKEKHIKKSTSDPESGWFRKGEHKHVFAYSVETACDRNGIILGYSVHPGNENDGKTFPALFEKIKHLPIEILVGDSAYKTPAIAHLLSTNEIQLLSTYTRPVGKEGFLPKYEYVYDEYYDCYICPNNHVLTYHTTNRDGRREYRSDPRVCANCPYLAQCTESKECKKTVQRHIWEGYVEQVDDLRYNSEMKDLYGLRKETVERDFAIAKELHGFRYTQLLGKARMEMKAALTYLCLNLKKLAKKRWKTRENSTLWALSSINFGHFFHITRKLALGKIPNASLSTV